MTTPTREQVEKWRKEYWDGSYPGSFAEWNALHDAALRSVESAPGVRVSMEALKLAREFVADPDMRAQVKVQLSIAGYPKLADLIDEAVVVSRELLRLHAALGGE